ncbi:nitroreductase family protein [Amycolatopsis decaplanina]|uniref:Putative nitroreductase n=1 Tax=Amycolatopsis decaplanina DSM 44594 TaxID=1284240 RepID=M2WUV5_9PSEU|nr:nitroreductase family protein [Amycolatopsis decaplanina]EME52546.1 Putative nitroreductase [Amycolatopsis decaplanina DSM 44594]
MSPATTTPDRIAATRMGHAVANDPQFTLPTRARKLPGLVEVPLPSGYLVEGAATRQVFSGKASVTLLPRVLGLLDGNRTYAEIAATVGIGEADVVTIVSLLYTRGLVEEGLDPAVPAEPVPLWLTRHIDSSRVHRSGHRAWRELRSARVAVVAPPDLATELTELLVANSVTTEAVPVRTEDRLDAGFIPDDTTLVIGLTGEVRTPTWLSDLDRLVDKRGGAWLRAAVTGGLLELGPRFDARVGLTLARWELGALSAPETEVEPGVAADAVRSAALAVLATEITNVVSRMGSGESLSTALHIDLNTGETTELAVAPGPIATLPQHDGRTHSLAITFDEMVRFPPKDQASPKGHLMHYVPANTAKQYDHKIYSPSARLPLPKVNVVDLAALATAAAPVEIDRLVLAVRTAFGLQPGGADRGDRHVHRYHATGGNLGSPQAYLAIRDVGGLPAGWWHYDPFTHELVAVAPFDDESTNWLDSAAPGAPAVVVSAGALSRVAAKYGPFAARVIHMDAGVSLHQLGETCRLVGLSAQRIGKVRFEDVARLLGLDPAKDPVTEIVRIDPANDAPAAQAGTGCAFTTNARVDSGLEFLVSRPIGSREEVMTEFVRELQEQPAPPALGRLGGASWSPAAYAVALANRHGGRVYGPGEIDGEELADLLRRADRAGSLGWSEPGTGRLGYLVLAQRVTGLAPGFHRFDPAGGFSEVAELPTDHPVDQMVLQAEFADAAAIGVVVGRTPHAVHELGAHGYRILLARGSAAVNEVWLGALAAGREACGFAGLIPHALTAHGRLDLREQVPLFTFAIGTVPYSGFH